MVREIWNSAQSQGKVREIYIILDIMSTKSQEQRKETENEESILKFCSRSGKSQANVYHFGCYEHQVTKTTKGTRTQVLSSPERKTLVGSGHMAPRFWVVTNKINVEDVLKINSCSYLAKCREENILFTSKQTHVFD